MEEPDPTRTPIETSGGPSDFEKIGLPILLLFIIALIFFLAHAAITWLPECEWWKKLTQNYENVDDDKATFLQRRRGSLRRKLKRYKDTSKAQGNDGRGGLSTGETSISDFDQVKIVNRSQEKDPQTLSKAPSKSSIEENEQPLNVAKFYNKAFDNDLDDQTDDLQTKGILREKKVNKQLERYRHSAEFYSQFSLVPLEKGEVGNASVESIDATVHSSIETLDEAPVAPRRKKYTSAENLSQPKRYDLYKTRNQRPMATSMHDLRQSASMSFSNLREQEIENDTRDYKSYINKALAKSVDDVRKGYASSSNLNMHRGRENMHQSSENMHQSSENMPRGRENVHQSSENMHQSSENVHQSSENISKTYGGSNGYLAYHNKRADYDHPPHRSAAKSVEDVRKVNGYRNGYERNGCDRNSYDTNGYDRKGGDTSGLSVHRSTARSADDLTNDRQYNPGSLPSSNDSSYQSLESRSHEGSYQSLNGENGSHRPQNARTSYAKPRASRRARRNAPQPGGMPNIPENITAAPSGHPINSQNDQPTVLQTSHANYEYELPSYRGAAVLSQASAKV